MKTAITFIGAGNMSSALIGGLVKNGVDPKTLLAVDPSKIQRDAVAGQHGIATAETADDAALAADAVVLAVKPQVMAEVARGLEDRVDGTLVVSVAAGIRAKDLSRWLGGHRRIVRCMPNTPALIGRGVTAMAAFPGLGDTDRQLAQRILDAVGETVWVDDEASLDAVTALSGSGPAYVFYFMEAMQRAGESLGLSEAQARALTIATFRGAAELAARSDEAPGVLRERVTSKGGTTAAALASLQASAVDDAIGRALAAACRRSEEMGQEFGAETP
ncbi:MAG: pyrroline-5-carboxylate reductase [Burkholderiaceae bacterium]|nr:pyrroline-5-carboxylate reductase [Burkholderiaceae bacterium]